MKIRLVQKDISNLEYKPFLDSAENDGVDLVCLGELSLSGCLYHGGSGIELDTLVDELSSYSIGVMLGFPKLASTGIRNSYIYFHRGEYQVYDKINLFPPMNEDKVYQPGTTVGIFETRWVKMGIAICYDLRFPQLFEQLKDGGAEIILVPAAFPRARISDWKELLVQRAVDYGVYVFGINAIGNDGVNEFGGCSMAVARDGTIIASADEINESIIEVSI